MSRLLALQEDRTTKQPIVWICFNPCCIEGTNLRRFEFESEYPECPKCGAGLPFIQKRALIHLLVQDKLGNIVGQYGQRYRLACNTNNDRWWLATNCNEEAASGDPSVINCPTCIAESKNRKVLGVKMDAEFMKQLKDDTKVTREFLESLRSN